MKLGYNYLEISQVLEDVKDREKFYRHISKGGWPFSTRDHGWPISDCTAEGLKATLALHETVVSDEKSQLISPQRCFDAVNVLLSFQNDDGGWATYENTRAPAWLELINPAEVRFTHMHAHARSLFLPLSFSTPTRTFSLIFFSLPLSSPPHSSPVLEC
jgi:squalene cyclase